MTLEARVEAMVAAFATISEVHYGLRREPSMTRRLEAAFASLGQHLKELQDEHGSHHDPSADTPPDGGAGAK